MLAKPELPELDNGGEVIEKIFLVVSPAPALAPDAKVNSLWHNRNFNIFWSGQTLSALGDAFAVIATPLLVLQATGSVAQMGIVTGLFGLGQVLAGLVSGLIVDRVNRRRLMIGCDVLRTLVYATIPLGWWLAGPQLGLVYFVSIVGAALSNFFSVAYFTTIPNIVDRALITAANGRLQTTISVTFVAGPALAGLVSAQFGPATAIGVNALSFAISALSLFFVRIRQAPGGTDEHAAVRAGFVNEYLAGITFLWHQPVLRAAACLLGIYAFLGTAGIDLYIFYIKHNLGQADTAVGIVFGFSCVGGIGAGLSVARIRSRLGFGWCFLGGAVIGSLMLALVGLTGVITLVLIAAVYTFVDTIKVISTISLRQQITPDHLLGRVTAVFWLFLSVPGPLGATLFTGLAEKTSVPLTFLAMGAIGMSVAVIGLFTPARLREPEKLYLKETGYPLNQ
jgi:MFS family permease